MSAQKTPVNIAAAAIIAILFLTVNTAKAQITQVENLFGKYALSVDGCENNTGSGQPGSCPITINKPSGATLYKAYLVASQTPVDYSAFTDTTPLRVNTTNTYAGSIGPVLSTFASSNGSGVDAAQRTRYANVTTDLSSLLNGLPAGANTLYLMPDNVEGNDGSTGLEGRTLLVIWYDPNGSDKVISIALGSTTSLPATTFTVNTPPLNITPVASTAIAGLGINFSTGQGDQSNNLSVNSTLITNEAGGFDDGVFLANGELFTIGDDGDAVNTTSEKYNIKPALINASTSYTVTFQNVFGHAEDYCTVYYSVVSDAFQTGNINGTLYNDLNTNSALNAGEPGLPANITVNLYRDDDGTPGLNVATDHLVATTITDAAGHYTFPGITVGTNYIVQVDLADTDIPSAFTIETPNPVFNVSSINNTTTIVDFGFIAPNNPCTTGAIHSSFTVSVCSNQTYQLPSGAVVTTTGTYIDTIRTQSGNCDSLIYTVTVSAPAVAVINTDVHICPGQSYQLPSGATVNTEGVYADTLRNLAACDSVIKAIHLIIDRVTLLDRTVHICPNTTYQLPSGSFINAEGTYIDTLRSQASCDSIINTIHLIIDRVTLHDATVHICPGSFYQLPTGTIVTAEGNYTDTLRSRAGCDSIITTTHLFIDNVSFQNSEAQICSGQTYQLPSGNFVSTGGNYIDTVRSQASCDSIINTIHLTVNDNTSSFYVDSIYKGQTYTLPSGSTVSAEGTYQSVLTNSLGCDSVITTVLKVKTSIFDCVVLRNAFTPNNDGTNDLWVLFRFRCFKRMRVDVYNRYGSLVYHSDDYQNDWNGKYKNQDLPDATYYYYLKVTGYDGVERPFRDNVTILR